MSESFHVNLNSSGWVVLEKKIFKVFSYINTCKNGFPYCGPTQSLEAMILTNLNLHYVKKLPGKIELFWLSGSWEEDFQMTPPYFCIFVIISPLKRTWPFIWTNLNPLPPKDDLWQVWLKLAHAAVLEKKSKMWKVYRQTDGRRTTDDQKSSLELSAQVS